MSSQPIIVCAAIRANGYVIAGARHFDSVMLQNFRLLKEQRKVTEPPEQGFIDQFGDFHDRQRALQIAIDAGQINQRRPKTQPLDELYSEDLY